jgi:regulator of protease activity HflC (stomatin/prohibitin superfamily)
MKKARFSYGYITAAPADYAIHTRRGVIIHQGLGIAFWCLPPWDRYCLIPATAQNISFAADQITRENQGVEIAGFAIWRVAQPEQTYLRFDFHGDADPIETINRSLREVVESAIRHQMANLSIEDVLRKRASIIEELQRELADIAGRWGLTFDTIEIKQVKILSSELFANLQAPYRNALRLESQTSELNAERAIAAERAAQREEAARRELDFRRAEIERGAQLFEQEQQSRRRRLAAEAETLTQESSLQAIRHGLERAQKEHARALAEIDAQTETRRLAATNTEDAGLAFVRALPQVAERLKINELNLGDDLLSSGLAALQRTLGRGANHSP